MRIICHAQHLSGVGHFVRMHAIACGLSTAGHEVHLVEGGRPVAHLHDSAEPRALRLPPLARSAGTLVGLGSAAAVDTVIEARARDFAAAVERIRPDVMLIDHYPFSKWELDREIAAAVDVARGCNPAVRILCSLRDIVRQTRHEEIDSSRYQEHVVSQLGSRFHGILVHADPAFTRIEKHFARSADLPVRVEYTGFVTHSPPSKPEDSTEDSYAVLSCGGGVGALAFLLTAMEAFRRLADRGVLGPLRLIVFASVDADGAELERLQAMAGNGPFRIRPFSAEFERFLDRSAFSISRAGYNTCAALLRSRVRAVLVPDPVMSDQEFRARRLAELGLATVVEGNPPDVRALMGAIEATFASAAPRHDLNMDGVARTRALVEAVDIWSHTR